MATQTSYSIIVLGLIALGAVWFFTQTTKGKNEWTEIMAGVSSVASTVTLPGASTSSDLSQITPVPEGFMRAGDGNAVVRIPSILS